MKYSSNSAGKEPTLPVLAVVFSLEERDEKMAGNATLVYFGFLLFGGMKLIKPYHVGYQTSPFDVPERLELSN